MPTKTKAAQRAAREAARREFRFLVWAAVAVAGWLLSEIVEVQNVF